MRFGIRARCLAAGALVAVPAVPAAAQATLSGNVVFATSPSHSDNAFALRGATGTPPDYDLNPLLIPSAPASAQPRLHTSWSPTEGPVSWRNSHAGADMPSEIATLALMTTPSPRPDAPGPSIGAGQENPAARTGGRSEADAIRQRVKEGQTVRITDDGGREWHGRIEALAPDSLVLVTKDGQRRDIPYAGIVRIDRPHDTLGNGALIGLVSGAAFGVLAVISEENADCDPGAFFSCGDPTAAAYFVFPAVTGAIGAGVGVAIDALIRRDPTLFRRGEPRVTLAPSLGRGVRGLRLSVRW